LVFAFAMGCASREPAPTPQATKAPPVVESETPLAAEPTPVSKPPMETARVTSSQLNLRSGASSNSSILGVLKKGDALEVLSRKKDWVEVQSAEGRRGWVAARYLSSEATAPAAEAPGSAAANEAEGELSVNGKATALKYAYAYSKPSFFDKSRLDTVVILSNMALDEEALTDWTLRQKLEKTGTLRCVELTINTGGQVISRKLRHLVLWVINSVTYFMQPFCTPAGELKAWKAGF